MNELPRRQVCACGKGCNKRSSVKWNGYLVVTCVPDDEAMGVVEAIIEAVYCPKCSRRGAEDILLQEKVLVGTFFGMPVFTDTPRNAASLVREIDRIQNEPQKIASALTNEMNSLKGDLLKSENAFQVLEKQIGLLEEQLKELKDSKEYFSQRVSELEKENQKLRSSWVPGVLR